MLDHIQHHLARRPVIVACAFMLALAIALLLGRWLAVADAPLTRHAVARSLLENGSVETAAYVFDTPIWQGVALYRAGRFHRAVGAFVTDDSVTGLYNMGNAYARLGLYRGAITAYETVLRRRPNHEDALFNLELVRKAAARERELEDESRETENAGNWEDGLRESEERGEPEITESEQAVTSEETDPSDPEDEMATDRDADTGAGQTAAPESEIAGEQAGGSEKEGEQAEASTFSLAGSDDEASDDLSPDGKASEETEVLGGVVDRAREEAIADEIVLRRINDDAALVLRARLNMALRKQRAAR